MADIIILGCGYTGSHVARIVAGQGHSWRGYRRRDGFDCRSAAQLQEISGSVTSETRVLLSVPTLSMGPGEWFDPTADLVNAVRGAKRIVYLSTTGVYGAARHVDENTPVGPRSPRETLRVQAERAVLAEPGSMVLRPAAIYGPFRGAHVALREGRFALPATEGTYTSRIHVEDLAAITAAALFSDLGGAWPVADEEPCTPREMAAFCANMLGIPVPAVSDDLPETRRADRQVDGSAVLRALHVGLRYRSYREGIPASLLAEQAEVVAGKEE